MIDRSTWEDYVSFAVDEVRHFGVEQLQVMRRLRAMFEDLQRVVPDERKAVISRELALLARAVKRTFPDALDQERASEPDEQGIGSSPRPATGSGGLERVNGGSVQSRRRPSFARRRCSQPLGPSRYRPGPSSPRSSGWRRPTHHRCRLD